MRTLAPNHQHVPNIQAVQSTWIAVPCERLHNKAKSRYTMVRQDDYMLAVSMCLLGGGVPSKPYHAPNFPFTPHVHNSSRMTARMLPASLMLAAL